MNGCSKIETRSRRGREHWFSCSSLSCLKRRRMFETLNLQMSSSREQLSANNTSEILGSKFTGESSKRRAHRTINLTHRSYTMTKRRVHVSYIYFRHEKNERETDCLQVEEESQEVERGRIGVRVLQATQKFECNQSEQDHTPKGICFSPRKQISERREWGRKESWAKRSLSWNASTHENHSIIS